MPYIDKEKFRMHIIMYQSNLLKVRLTDKEKENFIRMLDEVPTADVVERKKGTWIYQLRDSENDEYRCSVCSHPSGYNYDYCPYCGSCMEKTDVL